MSTEAQHMGAGSGKGAAAKTASSMEIVDQRNVLLAMVKTAHDFDVLDAMDKVSFESDFIAVGTDEKPCGICGEEAQLFETEVTCKGMDNVLEACKPCWTSILDVPVHDYDAFKGYASDDKISACKHRVKMLVPIFTGEGAEKTEVKVNSVDYKTEIVLKKSIGEIAIPSSGGEAIKDALEELEHAHRFDITNDPKICTANCSSLKTVAEGMLDKTSLKTIQTHNKIITQVTNKPMNNLFCYQVQRNLMILLCQQEANSEAIGAVDAFLKLKQGDLSAQAFERGLSCPT